MRQVVKEAVEDSNYFLIVGTKHYFDGSDPEVVEQVAYAKKLKKPFRVLLQPNTVIPDNFFDDVTDYEIIECDIRNEVESQNAIRKLCESIKRGTKKVK